MHIQYINNLRALACYLVILTHSAMPALDDSFGVFMVFFSLMGSPSSELFVMISSSLLAPTKLDMFSFYKKRFSKLIGPFFFWSMMILLINYFRSEINFSEFINSIVLFPIKPVTGVYWFVYAICGLYLVIPIISPWLKKSTKKELLVILVIWTITLLLPYLNIFFEENIYILTGSYYFILIYFGGFIGYLFLGVYLRKHPILITNKFKAFLFIIILLLMGTLPILYGYLFNRDALIILQDNLSISSVFFVIAIFTFFQNFKMPDYIEHSLNLIAKYSFGIYLIHVIVIDWVWFLLENYRIPHPIIETPFISIITLLVCLIIVRIIALFPKSKYIVGA